MRPSSWFPFQGLVTYLARNFGVGGRAGEGERGPQPLSLEWGFREAQRESPQAPPTLTTWPSRPHIPASQDARPASMALSVLRILRKARHLWSHSWDPQSNTCLPQHLARPPATLRPWGSWLKSCPTLARAQSPRVAVPAPFSLCLPHGSRSQGPGWQVPTVGPAGAGELCPTRAPVSLPVARVVHSPSLGLGG